MNDDQAACSEIEERALAFAKLICDSSNSLEQAERFLSMAMHFIVLRTRLGVNAPKFQNRIAEKQEAAARQAVVHANETLETQLTKLGIDHQPIFADTPALGANSADDRQKTIQGGVDE